MEGFPNNINWSKKACPVLDNFMSIWFKLESSERRDPLLRKCFHKNRLKKNGRVFSFLYYWLMGWGHSQCERVLSIKMKRVSIVLLTRMHHVNLHHALDALTSLSRWTVSGTCELNPPSLNWFLSRYLISVAPEKPERESLNQEGITDGISHKVTKEILMNIKYVWFQI